MSQKQEGSGLSRLATVCFIACFALAAYFLYLIFKPFFSILVWACLLAVVFQPSFQWILRLSGGRRTMAALMTCLLILLLIVVPLTVLGVALTQQAVALYHATQDFATAGSEAATRLQQIEDRPLVHWALSQGTRLLGSGDADMHGAIQQTLNAISRFIIGWGPSLLAGVGGRLYQFLMMFITMFFFFRDGPALTGLVKASSPLPETYEAEIVTKFRDVSYAVFYGSILTAIVQGTAGGLLFWMVGMSSALFWGALIAFASLVPVVGALLVWLPVSCYYYLILGDAKRGLLVLLIGGLVVSSIDNVLKPMIIRGRTDMHPMLTFLSILGGISVFGFAGLLLGPFIVAVFLSFLNFYRLEFRDSLK